ncbi:uncharacterized protein ALTATR162_LOCUS1296 [Alternaria atra]|uniref:Uncharacterized protein n=1 Tax=Alternaria atra TaxID=119953 RepID=A0A8J2HVF6_9PLEO|nr:uncharacterized protein ALTATR162_LOCUS1296 [Alternaria atra]CAG5143163.1 unnamed protein product [Alternaria atra]
MKHLQPVTYATNKMSSTIATTVSGSTVSVKDTKTGTSVKFTKEEALQKMAEEDEARRNASVAIQRKKLDFAKKKFEEELSSKGKNAILKHKPSRPAHRPVKKHRKPLPPPSNKEHNTRMATAETNDATQEKKQLAALSISRSSLNFDEIIEQRVVNGIIERVTQPAILQPMSSQYTSVGNGSRPVYDHRHIIEQCVINGVAERIPQSSDVPQIATSNIDTDSDLAAESDNNTDEDVNQLVRGPSTHGQDACLSKDSVDSIEAASATTLSHFYVHVPMTDADDETSLPGSLDGAVYKAPNFVKEAVSEVSSCGPSAILSMPNATLYPPRLSRDEQASLVAMHKKAVKAIEFSKEVTMVEPEVPQRQTELDSAKTTTGLTEPSNTAGDRYVATLTKMSNGPGITQGFRNLHEKLVAMHVSPLWLPITAPKQQRTSNAERKAAKTDRKKSVAVERNEPDFVTSLLSKPNGPGETKESRNLRNNLVEMYVVPPELPPSFKQNNKTNKARKSAVTLALEPNHELVVVDISAAQKVSIIAENHTFTGDELNTDYFTHDEETLIEDVSELGPPPSGEAKDDLLQVDVDIEDTTDKQTVVIPGHTTSATPPAPKSSATSRRSSVESSRESVRRKAEKARTTFLGKTSLETFVNTLDFELCDGTTTKDDICEAFASLAGRPTAGLDSVKIQRKIKLGGTSLYGFLHQLDFDDDEVTIVGKVMKIFNKAAGYESASSNLDVALWLAESSQDENSQRVRRSQRASLVSKLGRVGA